MTEKEIQLFKEALEKAENEFYLDAIHTLEQLIEAFQDSELVNNALYNIGLCRFNINQFEKAIEQFQKVIDHHPNASISILEKRDEYGKTVAKCHYAIMNCLLGMGKVAKARRRLSALDHFPNSYVVTDAGEKRTFHQLAQQALALYEKQ